MGKNVLIFEVAVREITNLIVNNQLRPGDKLPPERELSKQLNISRTSIREALQYLASNFIVQIKPGSGIYVNVLDETMLGRFGAKQASETEALLMIKNIIEMRMLFESYGFQEVAKLVKPEQIHMLYRHESSSYRHIQDEVSANPDSDHASMDFELQIISLQPNTILTGMYSRLNETWKSCMNRMNLVALTPEIRHRDHLEIIMAIEINSPKQIAKAVAHHLEGAYKALEMLLNKQGDQTNS